MEFAEAYALTVVIEAAVLWLLLRRDYHPIPIAVNAIVASSITLPFVWFAFPMLGWAYPAQIAASELFAVLVEAGVYARLFHGMGLGRALTVSLLCNAASFLAGLAFSGMF